jgi:uncharacterized peroxidase-related enzyme
MAFINTVAPAEAHGEVRDMYERQQRKYGYVPDYARVFSHRPEVMKLWADLLYGVRRNMDKRRFELVTVAAAMAVKSTYCSLAHGKALTEFFSSDEILAIVTGSEEAPLSEAEVLMIRFAGKIARCAVDVTAGEVEKLRSAGFSDAEIFDISAVATARTFFAQLCEGLGAIGDHRYPEMDDDLRKVLTVGRRLEASPRQRLAAGYERDLELAFCQG